MNFRKNRQAGQTAAGYFVRPKLWLLFLIFSKSKKLAKQGSSNKTTLLSLKNNHYPSLSLEKVTRVVSLIRKHQQDQMILRALMYCI